MNVEVERDAKTKILYYFVNWYPFEPKKVIRTQYYVAKCLCIGGMYVSASQIGVHPANFES